MNLLASFITFFIFCGIFDWFIKKSDIHNKLFGKSRNYKFKYTRTILIILILFLTLSIEIEKEWVNEKFGRNNYISILICALLSSIYINFAPHFFRRKRSLRKNNLNGIAKLMYKDVSNDYWDKENLTKKNLDFTIDSIRYIDMYSKRLMNTELGKKLLNEHFDHFVARIGAYIGEVIKRNTKQDFYWYEFDSVYNYTSNHDGMDSREKQSVLYSKNRDIVLSPLLVVAQFLEGNSAYTNLQTYVEEVIKKNS